MIVEVARIGSGFEQIRNVQHEVQIVTIQHEFVNDKEE